MEDSTPTTTATSHESWFQDAMKKGLVLAGIHILLFLLLYLLFPSKLTGFTYLFVIIALNVGYGIYQGIQWRNEIGGYMDFGSAFKYAFVILLFNGLLYSVFNIVFLMIEPGFPEVMAQSQIDTIVYWAQKFGAPDEALDEMRDKFNPDDYTKNFGPLGMLKGFGVALIFYAIGALIIGLITRKAEPETM